MKKSTQFPALKLKHWPFWSWCSRRNRSSLMLGVRSLTATISAGTCSSALPPWRRHCQRSVSARKRWGRSRIDKADEISGCKPVNWLFTESEFLNCFFLLQDFDVKWKLCCLDSWSWSFSLQGSKRANLVWWMKHVSWFCAFSVLKIQLSKRLQWTQVNSLSFFLKYEQLLNEQRFTSLQHLCKSPVLWKPCLP